MTKLDKYLSEIRECEGLVYPEKTLVLLAMVELLRDALEFECDGTCARGINPCNAREALDKLEELVSE